MAAFTNLESTVYLALKAMYCPGPAARHGRQPVLAPKVDLMSLSLLLLGIGSFLFHATLRQTMEFCDELSILGLT
ncbi:hypothetical protein QBC42DRAFT_286249 [Cladorrhinum samala]|uniref:Uncharacterized protein n=1 Tax=Cladorrhinum samala TaxID=585594 RepID=A0AAV9HQK6_9PEZI|nr:hypothetical protein QBC42DRAFT_286249 [Cladorrhinum samala]